MPITPQSWFVTQQHKGTQIWPLLPALIPSESRPSPARASSCIASPICLTKPSTASTRTARFKNGTEEMPARGADGGQDAAHPFVTCHQ